MKIIFSSVVLRKTIHLSLMLRHPMNHHHWTPQIPKSTILDATFSMLPLWTSSLWEPLSQQLSLPIHPLLRARDIFRERVFWLQERSIRSRTIPRELEGIRTFWDQFPIVEASVNRLRVQMVWPTLKRIVCLNVKISAAKLTSNVLSTSSPGYKYALATSC